MDVQTIRAVLQGCRVLIIEDDEFLAKRIAYLFEKYTSTKPRITHFYDEAVDFITTSPGEVDLAIVDVMLPISEQDYLDIQEFRKKMSELERVIEEIEQPPYDQEKKERLLQARFKRSKIHAYSFDLIDKGGGIKLIDKWKEIIIENHRELFPILFLSARGEDNIIQKGEESWGRLSKWIIKPFENEKIIEECINLVRLNQ